MPPTAASVVAEPIDSAGSETSTSTPPQVQTAVPSQTHPQSRQATLKFHVTDVYGWEVQRPGLSIILKDIGGAENPERDGSFKVKLWASSSSVHVLCGDLNSTHTVQPGENVIPLDHGSTFGEVAIHPADWDKVRIRLVGTDTPKRPTSMDPQIGRRFLFVSPGTYEVLDHGEFVAGRVEVVAGKRSTFTLTRLAGIKLEVAFSNEAEGKRVPKSLPIRLRGLSPGASHESGYRILVMTGHYQRMYVETGLVPGTYEVTSEELSPRFLEVVDVRGGEVRTVRILHTLP